MHFDFQTFFSAFLAFLATYFGAKHGVNDGQNKP